MGYSALKIRKTSHFIRLSEVGFEPKDQLAMDSDVALAREVAITF